VFRWTLWQIATRANIQFEKSSNVRYLLDTNQLGYIATGSSAAAREMMLRRQGGGHSLCISVITEAELLYGLAKKPEMKSLRVAVQALILQTQVLPWGREEAAVYGRLRAAQERLSRRLEPMDMLIAAHAVATESVLVSRDKIFRHVPELAGLENWATDL
jgi:tRNA(fMet)-specific endonuclease VapC